MFLADYNGEEYILHSPGKIKSAQKLLVGDIVEFEKQDDDFIITKVYERKNSFIRPQAANIDIFLIVSSIEDPQFDQYLTDKLLVYSFIHNCEPVVLLTKSDLNLSKTEEIKDMYEKSGIDVYVSGIDHESYDDIEERFKEKLIMAVGNSGVGKSTFLNQLARDTIQKTAVTSKKLGRGRHTTRHVEIFDFGEFKLIDTPGFASLDIPLLNEGEHLQNYFPEFLKYKGSCKFNTCKHINEPGCAVKKALNDGFIDRGRYENYLRLAEEVKNMEVNRW
ncbi:ribosome small subunit-dependent GTPase A [Ezakiella peruensis]|uniref:ribosome small subunit-dependent GTPase A n=1 Tax=Ezakiella peruensis TaxID=1464038 RepID=UPI00147330A5|nr:ribosome small subunit-dependent GTPase A [Ezakiella peruensis]